MKKFKLMFILFLVALLNVGFLAGCDINNNAQEQTVFTITVNQNEHGIVAVDKNQAEENENVTILTQPEEGYSLYAILCDGVVVNANIVSMPKKNIVISAIFQEISNDIALTAGNYVMIVDAKKDGSNCICENFFSTVTIKENNLLDIILRFYGESDYQLATLNDITYNQNDRLVTSNILGTNYEIHIIDNKTFVVNGFDNYMEVFCYQDDLQLPQGTFVATFGDSEEIRLNIKSNNKLDAVKINSGEEGLNQENLDYFIKGNNMFVDLGDEYACVKLVDVSNDCIEVRFIEKVTKDGRDLTVINETSYVFFNLVQN